jgi:hypothetical protein
MAPRQTKVSNSFLAYMAQAGRVRERSSAPRLRQVNYIFIFIITSAQCRSDTIATVCIEHNNFSGFYAQQDCRINSKAI